MFFILKDLNENYKKIVQMLTVKLTNHTTL